MKKKPAKKPPAPLSPLEGQRQLEAIDRLPDECDPKASPRSGPTRFQPHGTRPLKG
jgi:hypothetical protein